MDFDREYSRLNAAQKKAVDYVDGPLIVIAGPGTGKTQILSLRAANILKQTDILPENILCLTFTEAAAENMRSRLLKLIGKSANSYSIYTFHGFGAHIIQNYPEFFYEAPLLSHLSELGEYDVLEKLMNKLHHDNPLAKKINNTFLHLPSVMRTISWFKQAGLKPEDLRLQTLRDKSFFSSANKFISDAFQDSPSPKYVYKYQKLLENLLLLQKNNPSSIGELSSTELAEAIDEITESSRYAKSITTWRNKWLSQVKKNVWQFADQQKNQFLIHLANLYEDYQKVLFENGYYTFDDMILRSTNSIENNEELKLNLQEKYQYILVDEYQDTNGAQDKILNQLSDNPVNEGKPNLMVVGDDDQAIYRFQGANSSVMQDFITRWDPIKIVLEESYRSPQKLLDVARGVIVNAENRLESYDKSLTKVLISKTKLQDGNINEVHSPSEQENYINTANVIKGLLDKGEDATKFAVLAPKHKYLEELVPYLISLKIPINYERREQILLQPRIIEILDLVELVYSASQLNLSKVESLIPKILAAKYWELDANSLWSIALEAQKDRKGWIAVLENSEDVKFKNFIEVVKTLSMKAKNESFELILAYLTGAKSNILSNNRVWDLPWRDYYFSKQTLDENPAEYINFMTQFDSLKKAFDEWKPTDIEFSKIEDFQNFINLYRKSKLRLNNTSVFSSSDNAISLMTVFKAKGLEWDNVVLLNIEEDVWGSKARSRNQSFTIPSTLKWIEPSVDSSNDLIRLFYVGLTRAKKNLYLTSYENKTNKTPAERLVWLDNLLNPSDLLPSLPTSAIISAFEYDWRDIYKNPTKDLNVLLKTVIDNYKLSSTHLIDFLSVDRGGPKNFLYRHLLKVPEELNPNAMYGDSIHKTLEFIHKQLSSTSKIPSENEVNLFFDEKLAMHPLTKDEFKFFKKRGKDSLSSWLSKNNHKFKKEDISEHDFSSEHIVFDKAKITGKIDVIRPLDNNNYVVIDYKTSVPLESWKGTNDTTSKKIYNYQTQLLFYKLLIDNSKFLKSNHRVDKGIIEFISTNEEDELLELEYTFEVSEVERVKNLINAIWNKIINLDFPDTDHYPTTIKGIKAFETDLLNGNI